MQTDYSASKSEIRPSTIKNLICLSLIVFLIIELPIIINYKSPETFILGRYSLTYFFLVIISHLILICFLVSLIAFNGLQDAMSAFLISWKRINVVIRYFIIFFAIFIVFLVSLLYLFSIKTPKLLLFETLLVLLLLSSVIVLLESSPKLTLAYVSLYTLLIFIAALEILLRLGHLPALLHPPSQEVLAYMKLFEGWVPAEGGGPKPNLDVLAQGPTPAEPIRFITNAAGFRNDRDFNEQPDPDAYRILYVGDSFVIGYAADQDETSGYIMEARLNDTSQLNEYSLHPEVLIAYADDPSSAWIRLRKYYLKYNPHLVILGITFGNDISQAYLHSHPEKGFYQLSEHDGNVSMEIVRASLDFPYHDLFKSLYLPLEAFRPEALSPETESAPTRFSSNLRQMLDLYTQTHVGGKVSEAWRAFEQFILVHEPKSWYRPSAIASTFENRPGSVYTFDPNASLGLFYSPTLPEVDQAFVHLELILKGINQMLQERDTDLMVVLFPQRFQVRAEDWEATVEQYGLDPAHFDLEYPNRRILADCDRNGITCFDTLPLLKEETEKTRTPFYFPNGDMHWNKSGHYLVGVNMAKFVWKQYLENLDAASLLN